MHPSRCTGSVRGGTLALVRNGDLIQVDVEKRSIELLLSEEELTARRAQLPSPEPRFGRGYGWMFAQHILQADKGCDFDFLETGFGETAGEPAIF